MIALTRETPTDPLAHVTQVKGMLDDMTHQLSEDASRLDEPKARALLETTSQVLQGLMKAFEHYEREQAARPSTLSRRSASSLRSVSLVDRLSLFGGQGL